MFYEYPSGEAVKFTLREYGLYSMVIGDDCQNEIILRYEIYNETLKLIQKINPSDDPEKVYENMLAEVNIDLKRKYNLSDDDVKELRDSVGITLYRSIKAISFDR